MGPEQIRIQISKVIMFLTSFLVVIRQANAFGLPTLLQKSKCNSFANKRFVSARRSFTSTQSPLFAISTEDEVFLAKALECAGNGFGRTFPNPAVGCILVRQDTSEVIGSGFHPRAGYPHAEVFALLEAAGHVPSGVDAAKSVVNQDESSTLPLIQSLADKYSSDGGPKELFGDVLANFPVTAYVTLEPCCHTGRTPPCASALVLAKVNRVVVGFRDPNPRVDGGGVKLLEEAGITVDLAEGMPMQACADMVDSFVKRIIPKDYNTDYSHVTGAARRALRRLSGQLSTEDALTEHTWTGKVAAENEAEVDALELDAMWMERLDFLLWQKELVTVRLNKAVGKKKMAKRLAERMASELGAHVARTVGHTSLLYRPGIPPFYDLDDLVAEGKEDDAVNGAINDEASGEMAEDEK